MKTLCWGCKKALGGCSWSKRKGKPVEGWDAEPTIVKDEMGDFESYLVKSCPEYTPDDKRVISTAEIAEILGICQTTVSNKWAVGRIIEEMQTKGYTVKYSWQDKLWYELRR